jgi:hypothetical protein
MECMGGPERRTVEAFGSCQVEVSLVDGSHGDARREAVEDVEDAMRVVAIP